MPPEKPPPLQVAVTFLLSLTIAVWVSSNLWNTGFRYPVLAVYLVGFIDMALWADGKDGVVHRLFSAVRAVRRSGRTN